MGSKFKYDKNIPAEILPSIQKNLAALECLVPPWCQKVYVDYSTDSGREGLDSVNVAASSINYPYRIASLVFFPGYLGDDEVERIDTCIHEMIHVSTLMVMDYAAEQFEKVVEDEKHRATIMDGLTERNEAMVCDLTHILQKRLGVGQTVQGK